MTVLAPLIAGRPQDGPCFPEPLWCSGDSLRNPYAGRKACEASQGKRAVSGEKSELVRTPFVIRRLRTFYVLAYINTIRAWLGHVSIDTTNVYAEVDLEMKAKALAACDTGGKGQEK